MNGICKNCQRSEGDKILLEKMIQKFDTGGDICTGPWWLGIILKCQDGELVVLCHIAFG